MRVVETYHGRARGEEGRSKGYGLGGGGGGGGGGVVVIVVVVVVVFVIVFVGFVGFFCVDVVVLVCRGELGLTCSW